MKWLVFLVLVTSLCGGMDRQVLRSLYRDDQHQWIAPSQVDRCGICLGSEDRITSLSCHATHRFCAPCINKWIEEKKQKGDCPFCRAPIVDSIFCTCLKSLANPSVLILMSITAIYAYKTIESCDTSHCDEYINLGVSAACALCVGIRLHQINHLKND